jgi:hypothetical protein
MENVDGWINVPNSNIVTAYIRSAEEERRSPRNDAMVSERDRDTLQKTPQKEQSAPDTGSSKKLVPPLLQIVERALKTDAPPSLLVEKMGVSLSQSSNKTSNKTVPKKNLPAQSKATLGPGKKKSSH